MTTTVTATATTSETESQPDAGTTSESTSKTSGLVNSDKPIHDLLTGKADGETNQDDVTIEEGQGDSGLPYEWQTYGGVNDLATNCYSIDSEALNELHFVTKSLDEEKLIFRFNGDPDAGPEAGDERADIYQLEGITEDTELKALAKIASVEDQPETRPQTDTAACWTFHSFKEIPDNKGLDVRETTKAQQENAKNRFAQQVENAGDVFDDTLSGSLNFQTAATYYRKTQNNQIEYVEESFDAATKLPPDNYYTRNTSYTPSKDQVESEGVIGEAHISIFSVQPQVVLHEQTSDTAWSLPTGVGGERINRTGETTVSKQTRYIAPEGDIHTLVDWYTEKPDTLIDDSPTHILSMTVNEGTDDEKTVEPKKVETKYHLKTDKIESITISEDGNQIEKTSDGLNLNGIPKHRQTFTFRNLDEGETTLIVKAEIKVSYTKVDTITWQNYRFRTYRLNGTKTTTLTVEDSLDVTVYDLEEEDLNVELSEYTDRKNSTYGVAIETTDEPFSTVKYTPSSGSQSTAESTDSGSSVIGESGISAESVTLNMQPTDLIGGSNAVTISNRYRYLTATDQDWHNITKLDEDGSVTKIKTTARPMTVHAYPSSSTYARDSPAVSFYAHHGPEKPAPSLPEKFAVTPAPPNYTRPDTFAFTVKRNEPESIEVYGLLGQKVSIPSDELTVDRTVHNTNLTVTKVETFNNDTQRLKIKLKQKGTDQTVDPAIVDESERYDVFGDEPETEANGAIIVTSPVDQSVSLQLTDGSTSVVVPQAYQFHIIYQPVGWLRASTAYEPARMYLQTGGLISLLRTFNESILPPVIAFLLPFGILLWALSRGGRSITGKTN